MTSFDALAGAEPSSSDRDLLAISRLLDTEWYQKQSSLPHGRDPVDHYLAVGWQNGIDPYNGFESDFLRPYYEASGHSGAPILTWLELSSMEGRRPPTCQREAEYLAARLKHTALFDEDYYRQTLRGDLDPALHYVLIGELIGYQPSRLFDPQFYLDLYEDIGRRDLSPLDHFIEHGTREGRRPLPVSKRLSFPPVCDSSRPTVLLLVHDASRTGAPVLGWNIVRALSHSTNVVSVIMHGGVLEECFLAASAAVVGPMTWDEWQPMEMRRVAARLVDVYHPLYAIANSIETSLLVPPLAALGVPSVALVHEFAAYTRPVSKIRDVLDWATHIVFPSKVVADAMFRAVPSSRDRQGTHVMPQGRSDLPGVLIEDSLRPDERAIEREIRPNESLDAFVVLGLGTVQYRKGVDLFLATAACARRMAPDLKLRFVWVGEGYDPDADFSYSAYLSEQIIQSDIGDMVVILGAVENLDPVYRCADVLFLSSRLDPQPNVGIDALTRGLPTVCFDGASGTAEALSTDVEARRLVAPHLDCHIAAEIICSLAKDPTAMTDARTAVARVGKRTYDMVSYIHGIDALGRQAVAALRQDDLKTLAVSGVIDQDLALPPGVVAPGAFGPERHVLQQWAVVGTSVNQISNRQFRRPCAGFHPQAYASAHPLVFEVEEPPNPVAHWLRAGRPDGVWSRKVFTPRSPRSAAGLVGRVALHAHFYYVYHATDFANRLAQNETQCDLYLSTDTEAKADRLRSVFANHRGRVEVQIMPNRGRDIGPFLTGYWREVLSGRYQVFGHFHGKQSADIDTEMGDQWRSFLWENLVGGSHSMVDVAVTAFAMNTDLGLLIAEDPHLVGWDQNRAQAQELSVRMGMTSQLDTFFDFPLGAMFWATPSALRPLIELGLEWDDYPTEPLELDGTLLHALERLVPFAARQAGLAIGGLRVPGTTW